MSRYALLVRWSLRIATLTGLVVLGTGCLSLLAYQLGLLNGTMPPPATPQQTPEPNTPATPAPTPPTPTPGVPPEPEPPEPPDEQAPALALRAATEPVLTNSPTFTLRGTATDDRGPVRVHVGEQVATVDADGAFELDVPLEDGFNLIVAVARDAAGNAVAAGRQVILDRDPPGLALSEPVAGVINVTQVLVRGSARDLYGVASVRVQGRGVALEDETFETTLDLSPGDHTITVEATDAAGNTTTQTIELTVFISAAFQIESPVGARASFPAGALTDPALTVEILDLSNRNIRDSLGDEGGEILDAVPPGGLPATPALVIPGALALRFDAPSLPETPVNALPAFSVPAMNGLTNDIPLWILQMVPDRTGDGVPELILVSQARINGAGDLEMIPPGPNSPLPGPQFGREFGFDATTIGQVSGIESASTTYIYCCCGGAIVPIEGQTACEPAPLPAELLDEILTLEQTKGQLMDELSDATDAMVDHELNVKNPALLDLFLKVEFGLATAGLLAPAVEAMAAASTLSEMIVIAQGAGWVSIGSNGLPKILNDIRRIADPFRQAGVVSELVGDQIDLDSAWDVVAENVDAIEDQLEDRWDQAHDLSGCSDALVRAAERVRAARGLVQGAQDTASQHTGRLEALRARLQIAGALGDELEQFAADFEPLARRMADGTTTASDEAELRAALDRLALLLARARETASRLNSGITSVVDDDPGLERGLRDALAAVRDELDFLATVPRRNIPKSGVLLRVEAMGEHHSAEASASRFVTYVHTRLTSDPNGARVLEGGTAAVRASAGLLARSAQTDYPTTRFPGPGFFDFAVDLGTIAVGLEAGLLGDRDNDGVHDGTELIGGLDPNSPDTDGDGFDDRTEILARSDPRDPASIPSDDLDGDGLTDSQEAALGTNPSTIDTDRDGLTDGTEVNVFGTDPLSVDTDADNFTDRAELLLGSDPTDPSSTPGSDRDGDGVPDVTETQLGTDPDDPDTDHDGLPDSVEAFLLATDPLDADTDGDTIPDGEETRSGADGFVTDPHDPDTDRDLFSDSDEIANGSDPTDPTSVPAFAVTLVVQTIHSGLPEPDVHVIVTASGCVAEACIDTTDALGLLACPGLPPGDDVCVIAIKTLPDGTTLRGDLGPFSIVDEGGGRMFRVVDLIRQ